MARVYHADLYGLREAKYAALNARHVSTTAWQELQPRTPQYLFVPRDAALEDEYNLGWKLTGIMPVHSVGIVTARDSLTIQWTREDVWRVVNDFASLPVEDARARYALGPDARDWKVELAQADVRDSGPDGTNIVPILYRPFDIRFTYYTGRTRGFLCMPRPEVMGHMRRGRNLALVLPRRVETQGPWAHIACTASLPEHVAVSAKTIDNVFPLYAYLPAGKTTTPPPRLLPEEEPWAADPNFSRDLIGKVARRIGLEFSNVHLADRRLLFGPEDVFHYIYAIVHSPTYRTRYAEFLKSDFPRIPFTSDRDLFRKLCGLGRELVAYHLLEAPALEQVVPRFPVRGDDTVAKGYPRYLPPGRVHINKDQYFDGVPPEVWEFHVGGYQVCQKWLKDRRGRTLSFEALTHYQKIAVALQQTIRLMGQIDGSIPGWPIR